LWVWGRGRDGQLGLEDCNVQAEPIMLTLPAAAVAVSSTPSASPSASASASASTKPSGQGNFMPITAIACGDVHTLAVRANGEVWSWGRGANGRLGHGSTSDVFTPRNIEYFAETGRRMIDVAAGKNFSLALSDGGEVFAWGNGEDGQLGSPVKESVHPKLVEKLKNYRIGTISAGDVYICARTLTSEDLREDWNLPVYPWMHESE